MKYGRWQSVEECQCGFISYIWDGDAFHHSAHYVCGANTNEGVCLGCGEKNKWTNRSARRVFASVPVKLLSFTLWSYHVFDGWEFKEKSE